VYICEDKEIESVQPKAVSPCADTDQPFQPFNDVLLGHVMSLLTPLSQLSFS
jgi:hypothetical protein